jgi:uncharacterized membrane-anchored protein YitT (DUF2179 family)
MTFKTLLHGAKRDLREIFTLRRLLFILLGTAICSFGIYNVHDQSGITEGGALGLILLLNHWFGLPSSIATPIIDIICYALAFRALGRHFLEISAFSTLSMAMFFRIWEHFPPVLPSLADKPLLAALLGALFIGVGVGIVVKNGGSCGGDDALALFIHKVSGWRLSRAYLISDLTVLALSLTYIPFKKIFFSLITVTISSYILEAVQGKKKEQEGTEGVRA